jgi:hypothetical protein
MQFMKQVRALSILTASALLATFAVAQAPTATPASENSELHHSSAPSGPIVVKWQFKKGTGEMNLMVNPDGTYLFSGTNKDRKPGKDFDIALALKSSDGGIILFHYVGDASNGVEWSKQGHSEILKDDFATFAKRHDWFAKYHFFESAAGKKAEYEARERKREELKKAEEEARKRKDEAEAKRKREERQKLDREEAQQAAQHQNNGGGGGSSVVSTIGDVINGIGSVAGDIGGAVQSILSIF